MKNLILCSLLLVLAIPAFAAPNTIKTCATTIVSPDGTQSIPTVFDIIERDGALVSASTQTLNDQPVTREESAAIEEHSVRPGLSPESNVADLNTAETLIVHAMTLGTIPGLKDTQIAGVDLQAIRSAKIYLMGKATHMGLSAIVEAKDQDGKVLGSFMGGFLVSPCR